MVATGYEQTGQPLPPQTVPSASGAPVPFQINNRADLKKAIAAVENTPGGGNARALVRRYIIQRAKELGLTADLPPNWNANGTML